MSTLTSSKCWRFSWNNFSHFRSIWLYVLRKIGKHSFTFLISEFKWDSEYFDEKYHWAVIIVIIDLMEKVVGSSFWITWLDPEQETFYYKHHWDLRTYMCIKIFRHWAIGSISKNPWAITFELLGNCPMASPLATPLLTDFYSIAECIFFAPMHNHCRRSSEKISRWKEINIF
jgi:hypothetical protein